MINEGGIETTKPAASSATKESNMSLSSIIRCSNCRHRVIDAFISAAGLSIHPTVRSKCVKSVVYFQAVRSLSGPNPLPVSPRQEQVLEDSAAHQAEEAVVQERNQDDHHVEREHVSTPWYLQVDTPQREINPLLKSQQLPDLPPDAPPLLKPILEHVSVELGLDDLTLFDLREVDPPPALGANLIMVLGTARSEKHLHVSADRFCRWLKTTHKLSSYADGLLGRGELKLKLRRKAKRARLLSNVGSSGIANPDDGIRTGWICVNVGNVADGRNMMVHQDLQDDFVGFGEDAEGANVVVQMLTQEKREELDLEDLWGNMMRRFERKEARISEDTERQRPKQEVGRPSLRGDVVRSNSSTTIISPSKHFASFHKARAYSTTTIAITGKANLTLPNAYREKIYDTGKEPSMKGLPKTSTSDNPDKGLRHSQSSYGAVGGISDIQRLLDNVLKLPMSEARDILASKSSPFWTSFDNFYPHFPSVDDAGRHLSALCYAQQIGAVDGKDAVALALQDIESSFIHVPQSVYVTALETMLRPDTRIGGSKPSVALSQKSLCRATEILERMSLRGIDIATDEIRSMLQIAVLHASNVLDMDASLREDALQRLRRLLRELFEKPGPIDAELEVLHKCADVGNWDGFWDIWRGFARAMRPRTKEMYVAMFRRIAERGHQAETMSTLRDCVPGMVYEEPPVAMDAEIAESIKTCLFVAEPDIARIAAHQDAFGEWAHLWRRCNHAILGHEKSL